MKILINRFTLRHNNVDYGVGDILEVEDVTGKQLVTSSNGAISIVADREVATIQPTAIKGPDMSITEKSKEPEDPKDPKDLDPEAPMALPDANPAQAMNKGKGK